MYADIEGNLDIEMIAEKLERTGTVDWLLMAI